MRKLGILMSGMYALSRECTPTHLHTAGSEQEMNTHAIYFFRFDTVYTSIAAVGGNSGVLWLR